MKNKVMPRIIFIGLIIILIISIIIAIISKNNDRTINMYNDICNKENYTFLMKEQNSEIDYTLTIAKKGSQICIDTKSNEEHTSTLVKENVAYYIMHNEQEYYLYDSNEIDTNFLIDDLKGIEQMQYTQGHEKIEGKEYYYEEYKNITAFIMWLNYDEDESNVKTRFYYNGNNIEYIKNIVEENEELLKVEFSSKTEGELFEIPEDYAEL